MSRFSVSPLALLLLLVATSYHVSGFVSSSPRAFARQQLVSTRVLATDSMELPIVEDEDETTHQLYGMTPKITTIDSLEDFLQFLAVDDRLCIVKFHASWCKSCQKFGVKFRRLALDATDVYDKKGQLVQKGRVRLASIEFGANAQLCRTLGIKRLPNIHMYKGSLGRVAGFPCGPNKFPVLLEKMERFLTLSDEELMFEKKLDEGGALGDHIVTELQSIHFEEAMKQAALRKNATMSP